MSIPCGKLRHGEARAASQHNCPGSLICSKMRLFLMQGNFSSVFFGNQALLQDLQLISCGSHKKLHFFNPQFM